MLQVISCKKGEIHISIWRRTNNPTDHPVSEQDQRLPLTAIQQFSLFSSSLSLRMTRHGSVLYTSFVTFSQYVRTSVYFRQVLDSHRCCFRESEASASLSSLFRSSRISRTTEYYQTYITQKQTMRDKGIFFRITMTLHLDGPIILPFLFLLSLMGRLELPNLGRTLMKLYHAARKNQKFTSCSFLYTKKISWSPQPRKQKRRSLSPKSQLQQTAKKQ